MSSSEASEYQPIKQTTIGDRQYDLMLRPCAQCGGDHHQIWRWCGSLFACYRMPPSFTIDKFEQFVTTLDTQLLEKSNEILEEFAGELSKVNSSSGIDADFSFSFRLLEYGRQRLALLNRLEYVDALSSEDIQEDADKIAVRAAFELGFAAAQHRIMVSYEDYLHAGIAMSEWRHAGLPKAREERVRQGAKTRAAVLGAARKLYKERPALSRNDSETARQIMNLRVPALQKGNNQQLGLDAITRHLREARRNTESSEN